MFIILWTTDKRELIRLHISGCRCNERLKAKTDGSKCLTYTGLFMKTKKTRGKERKWDGVGVMKDKDLKVEDDKDPHTMGWGFFNLLMRIIDTTKVSIHRFHRRSRKPLWGRVTRVAETEEPECSLELGMWTWGGCGCVSYSVSVRYTTGIKKNLCLLFNGKVRGKEKTYIWVSVWWKTKT